MEAITHNPLTPRLLHNAAETLTRSQSVPSTLHHTAVNPAGVCLLLWYDRIVFLTLRSDQCLYHITTKAELPYGYVRFNK